MRRRLFVFMPAVNFDGPLWARYMLVATTPSLEGGLRTVRAPVSSKSYLQAPTMLVLDRQSPMVHRPRSDNRRIQLRLRGDGQLFDIEPGKTTIGSSPRCNLRIQRPGVQPVHCLIVDGPEGLTVRRWAGTTKLNGKPFEESVLVLGDCLSVGPVDLEIIGPPALEQADEWRAESKASAAKADEFKTHRVARDAARARTRRLLDALRRERTEKSRLSQAVADLQNELHFSSDDLKTVRSQLVAAQAELGQIRSEFETAQQQIADLNAKNAAGSELAAGNERLNRQVVELTGKLENMVRELKAAHEQRARATEACASIEQKHTCVVEECGRLQIALAQATRAGADVDDYNRQLADGSAALARELESARRELSESSRLATELQSQLAHANEDLSVLSVAKLTLTQQLEEAAQQREQLIGEIAALKAQIGRHEAMHADAETAWQSLSNELATLSESYERVINEKSELAGKCQQLEAAIQSGADSAASQQDVIDRVHQLTELVNELEQRLAVAASERAELKSSCDALKIKCAEAEHHLAVRMSRIAELESLLASAQANAEQLMSATARSAEKVESANSGASDCQPFESSAASHLSDDLVETGRDANGERPAAFDWSTVRGDRPTNEAAVENSFGWGTAANQSITSDEPATAGASAESWSNSCGSNQAGESTAWGSSFADWGSVGSGAVNKAADESQPAASIWGGSADSETNSVVSESVAPALSELGVLQQPSQNDASFGNMANEKERDPFRRPAPAEHEPRQSEPASYIERYSHMFAEESGASEHQEPIAPPQAPAAPFRPIEAPAAATKEDDDESIEQYMAKLLQRVRGDASPTIAAPSPSTNVRNTPGDTFSRSLPTKPSTLAAASDEQAVETENNKPQSLIPQPVKRKSAASATVTDLGALRAIANETARRAINRHELRKHRRNAVTKAIVATLAGVTSLWFMLDSPDWRSIQFVTACVSLLVAAYWAGETYRTLVESFRVAAFDPAEASESDNEESKEPGLPIDVESEDCT